MKYKSLRLLTTIIYLVYLSTIIGCGCKPTPSKEDREKDIQEAIERHREKLDLVVKEKLVGNKRLELKIVNRGRHPVDVTQYNLKVQVIDVKNAKGIQRKGTVGISRGFPIEGYYILDPDGIVCEPSAISDKHLKSLGPNITDEINTLIISTDWDATQATVKCILEPLHADNSRTKRIEKTVYWELG
jgi:hypothetical protein